MWTLSSVFPKSYFVHAAASDPIADQNKASILANHWFHVMELPNGEVMIPWDDER
jgi:hypothetical protein